MHAWRGTDALLDQRGGGGGWRGDGGGMAGGPAPTPCAVQEGCTRGRHVPEMSQIGDCSSGCHEQIVQRCGSASFALQTGWIVT